MVTVNPRALIVLMAFVLAVMPGVSRAEAPDVYVLNTSTGAPYADPAHSGFQDRVVTEVFRRIGLKGEVRQYSASKRALVNANANVDHGVAMRVKGLEKRFPNLVRVEEQLISNDFVAYSRDLKLATTSWNSMADHPLAYIHGWVIFERNLPKNQVKYAVAKPGQMFDMLSKKRVDMILYERWQGLRRAKDTGVSVVVHEPPLASVAMYMYVHKEHASLAPKLAAALKEMKQDGSYQKIFDETLTVLTKN
jgi:polar amino acid transport system substrate-binding protein